MRLCGGCPSRRAPAVMHCVRLRGRGRISHDAPGIAPAAPTPGRWPVARADGPNFPDRAASSASVGWNVAYIRIPAWFFYYIIVIAWGLVCFASRYFKARKKTRALRMAHCSWAHPPSRGHHQSNRASLHLPTDSTQNQQYNTTYHYKLYPMPPLFQPRPKMSRPSKRLSPVFRVAEVRERCKRASACACMYVYHHRSHISPPACLPLLCALCTWVVVV